MGFSEEVNSAIDREVHRLIDEGYKRAESILTEHMDKLKLVLEYIGEHFCEELSLDSLAERFYVSKYHLSHTFQSAVGTSVYRYIILKRLLMAKQMLAGGIPAGVVCRSCGFKDYANFFRAFKSEYGISPKAYVEMNFHAP